MNEETSHKQVFKSTAITGGSQIVVILVGIVRTKVLAVLLGPVGVGIAGLYQVIVDLIKNIAGLGIGFSSVKSIAQASTSEDKYAISRTILVLKRWAWITGLIGMLFTILFARQISVYTFGNSDHTTNIIILSVIVLCLQLTSSQLAILQGLRKIKEMAAANLIAAIAGLCLTVPLYFLYREKGIVPGMLIIAVVGLLTAVYYSRKIPFTTMSISVKETFLHGQSMARLGLFTVVAGFSELATMYVIRGFILQRTDADAMGQYIAGWTISTTYLSVVLGAMGADYFPRLSAAIKVPSRAKTLVNEQMEIAVLIISPIIIAMLTFIFTVVNVLYSKAFNETPAILFWQLIGDFFKVLSWCLMFVLLAGGKSWLYIVSTLVWSAIYISGVVIGWEWFGLEITGIAFAAAYGLSAIILLFVMKALIGFTLSRRVLTYLIVFGILITIAALSFMFLNENARLMTSIAILLIAGLYSYRQLKLLVDFRQIFAGFFKK